MAVATVKPVSLRTRGERSTPGDSRWLNPEPSGSDTRASEQCAGSPSAPEPTDEVLLQRIAADDDAALRLFYRRYAGLVFSLARRMLGDQGRAEEVLQETFVRVWRAAITYDPARGRPETWVTTIARNLAISILRKGQPPAFLGDVLAEVTALPDDRNDPEEAAWIKARRRIVRDAIEQLPEQQRRVVLLAYFGGLTQAQIAERLGEPLGTVKSRLRLALRRLAGLLQPELNDDLRA